MGTAALVATDDETRVRVPKRVWPGAAQPRRRRRATLGRIQRVFQQSAHVVKRTQQSCTQTWMRQYEFLLALALVTVDGLEEVSCAVPY